MLMMHRLGAGELLCRSLATTNPIELWNAGANYLHLVAS